MFSGEIGFSNLGKFFSLIWKIIHLWLHENIFLIRKIDAKFLEFEKHINIHIKDDLKKNQWNRTKTSPKDFQGFWKSVI